MTAHVLIPACAMVLAALAASASLKKVLLSSFCARADAAPSARTPRIIARGKRGITIIESFPGLFVRRTAQAIGSYRSILHITRPQNCAPRRRFSLIFPRIPEFYARILNFAG